MKNSTALDNDHKNVDALKIGEVAILKIQVNLFTTANPKYANRNIKSIHVIRILSPVLYHRKVNKLHEGFRFSAIPTTIKFDSRTGDARRVGGTLAMQHSPNTATSSGVTLEPAFREKPTTHAYFQQWHTARKYGHSLTRQRTCTQPHKQLLPLIKNVFSRNIHINQFLNICLTNMYVSVKTYNDTH